MPFSITLPIVVVGAYGYEPNKKVQLTISPQPNDFWWAFEGVELHRNPAIVWLKQVAERLVAATCQVHVPERLLVYHAKILPALRRDIDVAGR